MCESIGRIFKKKTKKLRQLVRIARLCHRTTPFWKLNYPKILLHAVRICRKEGFLPSEAFRLGLFNQNLSPDELSKYSSRKNLTKIQEALNPVSLAPLLKNKGIFYHYCIALGIPIPKLYAIFLKKAVGWSYNSSFLKTRDDWKRFFDSQIPSEFVIKPACGAYGEEVNAFNRTNNGFIDAAGRTYKSENLYDLLISNPKYDSFIIQQRLKNHPELVRLSGTQSLQTVRFITFVDRNGQCHILHAHLKPIIGEHLIDTFIDGLTGNVEAEISQDDGLLKSACQITSTGRGIKTIYKHPKTGVSFERFQLPLWPQACRLVKETAIKFLPIRTIGWDVALTPDGPYIVEGNIWWDPPNQHRGMDVILDALSCCM